MEQSTEHNIYHSNLPKKAKIIDKKHGHKFEIGEEVTLTKLYRKGKENEHYHAVGQENVGWYVHKNEIELL